MRASFLYFFIGLPVFVTVVFGFVVTVICCLSRKKQPGVVLSPPPPLALGLHQPTSVPDSSTPVPAPTRLHPTAPRPSRTPVVPTECAYPQAVVMPPPYSATDPNPAPLPQYPK
ncbi:uncharacterized protein LOC143279924 [Babylonia areolata]|uniref:uncharacterized protein LOC143279924 n=1 Tax=Babylonia areolata TaxID=304850 RepID=UPI003FD6937B